MSDSLDPRPSAAPDAPAASEGLSRRDWLKSALAVSAAVAGSAAFAEATALEGTTAPATKDGSATGPTKGTEPKAPVELIDATLELSAIAGGAFAVVGWKHGYTAAYNEQAHLNMAEKGAAAKPTTTEHDNLSVSKAVDGATPKLNQFAHSGETIGKGKFTIKRAGVYMLIAEMEGISVITSGIVQGGSAELPIETITLHYNKIKWTYLKLSGSIGGGKDSTSVSWDLEKNKAV